MPNVSKRNFVCITIFGVPNVSGRETGYVALGICEFRLMVAEGNFITTVSGHFQVLMELQAQFGGRVDTRSLTTCIFGNVK